MTYCWFVAMVPPSQTICAGGWFHASPGTCKVCSSFQPQRNVISMAWVHKSLVCACTPARLYSSGVGALKEQCPLPLQALATRAVRFGLGCMSRHPMRALVTSIASTPPEDGVPPEVGGGAQTNCAGGLSHASPGTVIAVVGPLPQ